MKVRIHVDTTSVANNRRTRDRAAMEPPLLIYPEQGECFRAWGLRIDGPVRIVYRPNDPHKGSVLWVETDSHLLAEEPAS